MTAAEQEYIKQIYTGIADGHLPMQTYMLAELVGAKPASATDMVKKLTLKGLLNYRKNHGFSLTESGEQVALQIIRRHRLWELFLTENLKIDWKQVHAMANELQSINSDLLVNNLEAYLGYPVYDPHGEVIPDAKGHLPQTERMEIYDLKVNQGATVTGFRDSGSAFLAYIEKLGLLIGVRIQVTSLIEYNHSVEIAISQVSSFIITKETAQKIYVTINE
ncbi:DtxR family iron (metal) dependent repressor [Mucilaginibacter frigoritolerans]|jgi:DtxR family transcriptional regulator, Mn-dependent transcriptional regulator|uniref:Transcriptional regulator MntR n=1 Tax=Mucilaginibacter frigoritolerans TaxID=652788 RepID=A0A562TST1_9SPHI|nr:metal-dependent transcriptional regulator [Mucilaginibacter frigoritolerans]TWI96637.1 DtxR family iron (metal) dependent repressor [Mucilaginibacter frigoritolerans]